jgi:HrpA-like RNA helicase
MLAGAPTFRDASALAHIRQHAGILLRRLTSDPALSDVSHVVVDEVHERALQSDFLLALLRQLVLDRSHTEHPLKIVLMSATIDLDMLSAYLRGCPTMSAQGRTFPVQQFLLEDVYEMTSYRLASDSPAALRQRRDNTFRKSVQKQGGTSLDFISECLIPIHPIECLSFGRSFVVSMVQ